jgi:hypothetical protein
MSVYSWPKDSTYTNSDGDIVIFNVIEITKRENGDIHPKDVATLFSYSDKTNRILISVFIIFILS